MSWFDWIASKHGALVHVPVAVTLLLPLALLASQRAGRGIRPWWTTSRYLSWWGALGALGAALSGFLLIKGWEILPPGSLLVPRNLPELQVLRLHQLWALGSVGLGAVTVALISRRRKEHQGIGVLGLLAGVFWTAATVMAGLYGGRLVRPEAKAAAPAPVSPMPQPPPAVARAAGEVPAWMLDYAALDPQHAEPVKSPVHGNRWIRVWVSREARDAYHAGQPLPPGTKVVMSSVENQWGRPSHLLGPLYGLEMGGDGKPALSFYWPQVPEPLRGETNGADRVFWQGAHPGLQSCQECHAQGTAPSEQRSQLRVPRRPRVAEPETPGAESALP